MCKVSVLFTALYAKCPYYVVVYMQSDLIMTASAEGAYMHALPA